MNKFGFKKSLIEHLQEHNYNTKGFRREEILSRITSSPPTKGMVRCAISELMVLNALKEYGFVFFSKKDFSNSKYKAVEHQQNLKFFDYLTPVVEFDFFGKHESDVYAIEVKEI